MPPWRPQAQFKRTRWRAMPAWLPGSAGRFSIAWAWNSLRPSTLSPSPLSGTLRLSWGRWSPQGEMVYCGQEIPAAGEELWHLAAQWLPRPHPQHVPRVPGPDHSWNRHPCARGPMPRTTQSRSWRWRRSQPASATDQKFRDCQFRFLLPHPASITCTSQALPPRRYHLLLGAGLLCP